MSDGSRSTEWLKREATLGELLTAPEEPRLEELADVYEVLLALTHEIAVIEQQLHQTVLAKRNQRVAFEDRSWLVDARDR